MNAIKMSLVNGDQAVTCRTQLNLGATEKAVFERFLQEIRDELAIGKTAVVEVEGSPGEPITFAVSQAE